MAANNKYYGFMTTVMITVMDTYDNAQGHVSTG